MTSLIEIDISQSIATVTLNDPATLNALSKTMMDELREAMRRAERSARAMILSGRGRGFCSGANLSAGEQDVTAIEDAGKTLETDVNPLMMALRDLRIPWISAVRGAAAGAGCSLALAADIVVAGESAYFLQAFTRIGLVPDAGSAYLLSRAAGRARAMEMMLLGEKIAASTALEWGLVNRVVADGEVESTARDLARRLADGPTVALALARKNAWLALSMDFDAALDAERRLQRQAGATADFREGVTAFREKRPPRFSGA